MDDPISLSLFNFVSAACPALKIDQNLDTHDLLDLILKALIDEELELSTRFSLLSILELQSSYFVKEVDDIELVLVTLKNVFISLTNSKFIQGQCLISSTGILLESSERFSGEDFDGLFSQHINHLLDLLNANNNTENVYVRSVAADSLLEVELCYPLILKPYLEMMYAVTINEMTAAHQQYSALLVLMVKHSTLSTHLDNALWDRYPELILNHKFLTSQDSLTVPSVYSNNQLVSFLVDQLPYCNPEGVVWITHHTVEILLHNTELRASCRVLKPLFFSSVYTFNCALFHLLLYLEKVLGRELFEDEEHVLLLKQLLLNCSHPLLPSSVILIYLEFLNDYLSYSSHQLKFLRNVSVLLPNQFDGPEAVLRKFILLSNILKHKSGSSFLLKVLVNVQQETKSNTCIKYKSVLVKSLFKCLSDYEDIQCEDIVRVIITATMDDVTIVPYILHFLQVVRRTFPTSELSTLSLTSLVSTYMQADYCVNIELLKYVIDIFQETISQKCSLESLKSILIYVYKHILCTDMCDMLSWSLGHKILKLCSTAIKEYDTSTFFYEINNVLQAFVTKSKNEDIQDRASLFLSLLLSLSDKKLKSVLHGPKQSIPYLHSEDSSFSSQSYIQTLDNPIVTVLKMKKAFSNVSEFILMESDTDAITSYQSFISSSEYVKKFSVRFSVKISPEYEYLKGVEALAIFIEVPKSWGEIDPVMVGHIKQDTMIDPLQTRLFTMVCKPRRPQPVQGQMRAQFSLENACHMCSLLPFDIAFSDFFCAIPISGTMGAKKNFFEALWTITKNSFQSNLLLEYPEEVVRSTLKQELPAFIVHDEDDECLIGILVPPGYHILMKCQFEKLKTAVIFVTDCLCLLGLMNSYVKNKMFA